jgi:sterol desaturase/sphingolipid hydroxylase (fatty acid hydroxylase superfamily)
MPNLIHYAIPFFIILMVVEVIVGAIEKRELYEIKDSASSISMGLGNVIIGLVAKVIVFGSYSFMYQFRLFDLGSSWWVWVLLFFAEDLTYYIFHRSSHEIRFFWASHVVHHSSQHYNLSTALRQTWTGSFLSFVFWLWLPLVGFEPAMIMTMQAISLLYQFWIHTETIGKMGFLEWFLNTPSHHRVHHGSDVEYLDRNHAGVLIIWDRLFGTFIEEKETPRYGLTKNIYSFNPLRIAFHEWIDMAKDVRNAPTWKDKFAYIFAPPGWSHDGSRQTAEQMREEERRNASSAK